MKFFLILDKKQEPSVTVVCGKMTPAVAKIEELCRDCTSDEDLLNGYVGDEIVPLEPSAVDCFFTRDGKVFALSGKDEYVLRLRIKQIAEQVDGAFIKINQGCIVNVSSIERFSVSFGGALRVVLKNGFSDYVSRREMSAVKRRFGL